MVVQGGRASEKEVRRKECRQLEEGTKSMERKGGGRKKDRERVGSRDQNTEREKEKETGRDGRDSPPPHILPLSQHRS